jgi:uncharacterized protein (UPF0262 family)
MDTHRIASINLMHQGVVRFNAAVEKEKKMALEDLVRTGRFTPLHSGDGPYDVTVSLENADRMLLEVKNIQGETSRHSLALSPLRKLIKDYFVMCEALQESLGTATTDKIEAIDMARRSLHDEAAELIISQLNDSIETCLDTSRRLFTLACVLHCR